MRRDRSVHRQAPAERRAMRGSRPTGAAAGTDGGAPWQLEMFAVSAKQQQKVRVLVNLLGPLEACRCLLLTNGDNPGALNHHLRQAGGQWSWADLEPSAIPEMQRFLREPVHAVRADALPFPDRTFDRVVVVDIHGDLQDAQALNLEIARLLTVEGVAIVTAPNGRSRFPAAVRRRLAVRSAIGSVGCTPEELAMMLAAAGLRPVARTTYGKFFTEVAELAVDIGYARALRRRERRHGADPAGLRIWPRSAVSRHWVAYPDRLYSGLIPALRAVSSLDRLVPGRGGYEVVVAAMKDG